MWGLKQCLARRLKLLNVLIRFGMLMRNVKIFSGMIHRWLIVLFTAMF